MPPKHFKKLGSRPHPKPRSYNPAIDPLLVRWSAQRQQTLRKAARRMGIPLRLLRRWLKTRPDLASALSAGRQVAATTP